MFSVSRVEKEPAAGGAIRINLYLNANNGARLLALNCSTFLSRKGAGKGGNSCDRIVPPVRGQIYEDSLLSCLVDEMGLRICERPRVLQLGIPLNNMLRNIRTLVYFVKYSNLILNNCRVKIYCYADWRWSLEESIYWSTDRFVGDRQYLKWESWYDFWPVQTYLLYFVINKVYLQYKIVLISPAMSRPTGATISLLYFLSYDNIFHAYLVFKCQKRMNNFFVPLVFKSCCISIYVFNNVFLNNEFVQLVLKETMFTKVSNEWNLFWNQRKVSISISICF